MNFGIEDENNKWVCWKLMVDIFFPIESTNFIGKNSVRQI